MKTVALAGNPNVGKSTLFNALTGMNQHTGNWPGKTVELAQGSYDYKGETYRLADLPGTYSLVSTSQEEVVAEGFLREGGADCTVVICDATCLERTLYLALQILELTPRVVLCVNLMDEAARAQRVVVLHQGHIAADGTPKEVFSQVELIHSLGLASPETVELCWTLNRNGFELPLDCLDIEECAQTLYDAVKV